MDISIYAWLTNLHITVFIIICAFTLSIRISPIMCCPLLEFYFNVFRPFFLFLQAIIVVMVILRDFSC